MNEKEIGEIRRRVRRDRSNMTAIYGCYVNGENEIVSEFKQSTGIMSENDAEKYFDTDSDNDSDSNWGTDPGYTYPPNNGNDTPSDDSNNSSDDKTTPSDDLTAFILSISILPVASTDIKQNTHNKITIKNFFILHSSIFILIISTK